MAGLMEKLHLKKHHETGATDRNHDGIPDQLQGGAMAGGMGMGAPMMSSTTTTYSGLGLPYTGASAHPQYGYQRLTWQQKADRFEMKAAEWQRRGNAQKAQKNREKAQRLRMRGQPGYVKQQRPQSYYAQRAQLYDQRALQYQQWGNTAQYQRYQGRANRIRTKYTLTTVNQPIVHQTTHVIAPVIQETIRNDTIVEVQPVVHREVDQQVVHHIEKHYQETAPSMAGTRQLGAVVQEAVHTNVVNEIQPIIHRERVVPVVERTEQHSTQHIVQPTIHTHEVIYERGPYIASTTTYTGLNFGYANYGASAHPTYGYQRLTKQQKMARYQAKAAEWERRGNMQKAQKNRQKFARYQQMMQPGYVRPQRQPTYYNDRAALFDQKAARYQQLGMMPQAQRYQGRAQRVRSKHGLGGLLNKQGGQNLTNTSFAR